MNWQRLVTFLLACVVLGLLTADLPKITGAYTKWAEALIPLIFIALFLVIYRKAIRRGR
jgi:hypothetical protein